jgi:hypothetical protein
MYIWKHTNTNLPTTLLKFFEDDQNQQMKDLREAGKIAKFFCFWMLKNKSFI